MPTTDPQPPADPITTDRLAAAVRKGMATQPLLATHARPVADRLTAVIRKRLPDIARADTGALMIHLSAYLSVEIAALSQAGETPNSAILVATSGAAVAGVELYGDGNQPQHSGPLTPAELAELTASIEHLSGPDAFDEHRLEPALIPVTHYVPRLLAMVAQEQPQDEREGDVRAVAEAVSILEGMLNDGYGCCADEIGRVRGILLDAFARPLDELDALDTKGGEER